MCNLAVVPIPADRALVSEGGRGVQDAQRPWAVLAGVLIRPGPKMGQSERYRSLPAPSAAFGIRQYCLVRRARPPPFPTCQRR